MGECSCGAVYTSDATGHNVGSAMVETLVNACGGNWDLAWDLLPQEDYLTGQVDNYDEISHQVVDTRKLDGRRVSGVLFFVRLQPEAAALAGRQRRAAAGPLLPLPPVEPERDPKRLRQRADKRQVEELVAAGAIDRLVDLVFDDPRTLRFLQRLLYAPDEACRWRAVHVLGKVCSRLATRQPGRVSDLLHRLFAACSDSASSSWGSIEAIGAIIGERPDLYGAFARHLLGFLKDPAAQPRVLWALSMVARFRPDLIRAMPFYNLFTFLGHPQPLVRAQALQLCGRIRALEVRSQIEAMVGDKTPVTIPEEGQLVTTDLGTLAAAALKGMTDEGAHP
ncbi:MAG: DVU0298 family protein [Thermodesulfobacteriota bacterium]